MRKAITPGKINMADPRIMPSLATNSEKRSDRGPRPSTGIAITIKLMNMTGARKKIELKGLLVAGLRRRRICVSAQRNPEENAAVMTRINPSRLKAASPATIITTPTVMLAIIRTSLMLGLSRWNKKANMRTKASDEDLHIAFRAFRSD